MTTTYNFDGLLELESDYFDDSLADELEQVIDEILDDFEGFDEFLTASQMSRAVQRNQVLSSQLGWQSHYDAIVRLLAATGAFDPTTARLARLICGDRLLAAKTETDCRWDYRTEYLGSNAKPNEDDST